jgi:hypothetical protein
LRRDSGADLPLRSDLSHAAIDAKLGSGDEAGWVAPKEYGRETQSWLRHAVESATAAVAYDRARGTAL